ncbi:DNA polymerase, partial [Enterobacter hormaechei]
MTITVFSTYISDLGDSYSISIKMKNGITVEIIDSLKILPFSVAEIAGAFNLPIKKGSINYNEYREVGHILTDNE